MNLTRPIIMFATAVFLAMPVRGSFDQQPGSARAAALGGAMTGLADSSDAVYYNAAGLGQMNRGEMSGTYSKLYMGLDDNSNLANSNIAVAWPLRTETRDYGVAAFGFDRFNLDSIYSETSGGIYWGKKVSTLISAGAGIKYLDISYGKDEYTVLNPVFNGGTSKSNVSGDAGVMLVPSASWSFGAAIHDLNAPDMGLKYEDKVATKYAVGAAYRSSLVTLMSDFSVQRSDTKITVAGEKWLMKNMFALRAAVSVGNKNYTNVSTGMGYGGDTIALDYSLIYPLSGLDETYGTHKVSFVYKFADRWKEWEAKRLEEERKRREAEALAKAKKEALDHYTKAVALVKTGEYAAAAKDAWEASDGDTEEPKYSTLQERLIVVTKYLEKSEGTARPEIAIRKGINAYAIDDMSQDAVDMIQYAYSLNPSRFELDRLARAIAQGKSITVQELVKGMNLAEQKINAGSDEFKHGRYYECVKLCQEALVFEPDNVLAYKRMGSAYYRLKMWALAKANWEKALKLEPNATDTAKTRELIGHIERLMKNQPQQLQNDLPQ